MRIIGAELISGMHIAMRHIQTGRSYCELQHSNRTYVLSSIRSKQDKRTVALP
jgi:hypothetical protein